MCNDVTITLQSGLRFLLSPNEAGIADKGYRNDRITFLSPLSGHRFSLSNDENAFNFLIYYARQSVERVLRRLTIFQILRYCWRYSLFLHALVVCVCAKLTNLNLLIKPLDQ